MIPFLIICISSFNYYFLLNHLVFEFISVDIFLVYPHHRVIPVDNFNDNISIFSRSKLTNLINLNFIVDNSVFRQVFMWIQVNKSKCLWTNLLVV